MLRRRSAGMKRRRKGKTTVAKQEDEGEVNDQRKEDQGDPSVYEQVLPLASNIKINAKAMVIVENAALSKGCVEKDMEDEVERRKEDNTMRVLRGDDDREKDADHSLDSLLPGIPLAPLNRNPKPPGVIFVLEKASLVPAYVGRSYQILNPDEHADFLRKKNMNPYDYRPDIIHEALLQIMGSQLCMAGGVQAIYIKTVQGVLVKVEPHTHIPKTLGPFCAMMLQLLQKLSIKARGKGEKLLRLVQNPVTKHLPLDSHIIGLSFSSKKAVRVQDYIGNISNDQSLVFVVGAMAHGKIDCDYINDFVSVSGFPLSAAACLRRICIAAERQRKIL